MRDAVAVAVGGALGSLLRYAVGLWAAARFGEAFPIGTLVINVAGSLVIGLAATALRPEAAGARLFVMAGLCGGFTTFSAFSLQAVTLLRRGETAAAALYVALSVGLCLAAVVAGSALGMRWR